jgi:hypothetical protein
MTSQLAEAAPGEEIRTLDQNAAMWAMLGDISKQVPWPVFFDGRCDVVKMDSESWKDVLTAGLEKVQRMAAGIDGGYVLLGRRTSKLGKKKMSQLLEFIRFFGDSKQVVWTDPKVQAFLKFYGSEA